MASKQSSSKKNSSKSSSNKAADQKQQAPAGRSTRGLKGFIVLLAGVVWLFQSVDAIQTIEWFPPLLVTLLGLGMLAERE